MPTSKSNSRVSRSTAASRNKTVAVKKIPQRQKAAAPSPGWVPAHPDLFQVPEAISLNRPNTRRSSMFQRVSSPSRYKNVKIPSSNCRRTRQARNISNNSPTRHGVMTRSRRSSVYYGNKTGAPLVLTPLSPQAPVIKPPAPIRSGSRQSTKSKASSKVSVSSNQSENTLVFRKPIPVLQSEMTIESLSEEIPSTEEILPVEVIDEMMSASLERSSRSAVSMMSAGQSSASSGKSTGTVEAMKISESSSYSKASTDSMFPVKSIPASASPTLSEEFVVPSPSDPEISFNASKQNFDTPRSKRFLESIESSPTPRVTQSFYPSSSKKPKLALPVPAASEKILTSTHKKLRGRSLLENSIEVNSSELSDSYCIIPQPPKTTKTPSRSVRDMSLKDISHCSSRLDSTTPLDIYQTPMAQKSLLETETFFETPENSVEEMENKENGTDINGSLPSSVDMSETTQSSSSRCIIL